MKGTTGNITGPVESKVSPLILLPSASIEDNHKCLFGLVNEHLKLIKSVKIELISRQ